MPRTKGIYLTKDDQRYVLQTYVNRHTGDHRPANLRLTTPVAGHLNNPIQFLNDRDWLAHAYFTTTKSGRLDKRVKACESYPTWPEGQPIKGEFYERR